jgi:phage tail-like protein
MSSPEPTFWLLDSRLGWKTENQQHIAIGSRNGLRLDADRVDGKATGPLSLTWLDGSLGGVTLPQGMAFDGDGRLYLLCQREPCIKRYEPNQRAFLPLPGISPRRVTPAGIITDGRTLTRPTGLAINGRKIYVVDATEKRVQVFALDPPFPLLYLWGPWDQNFRPTLNDDQHAWQPMDVAAYKGSVYILDSRYNRVLVHDPHSDTLRELLRGLSADGQWTRIVVDRDGRIYLLDAHAQQVVFYDSQGQRLGVRTDSGDIRDNFDRPAIRLHYRGAVDDSASGRFCLPEELAWCGRAQVTKIPASETPLSLCLPSPLVRDENIILFTASDFKDLGRLAARLRRPCDPLAQYLRARFSDATRKLLDAFTPGLPPDPRLEQALLDELNALVTGPSLYDENRFAHVKLPEATLALIRQQPIDSGLVQLNRLLLEQGFSLELRRNPAATPGGLVFDREGNQSSFGLDEPLGPNLYVQDGTWIGEFLDSGIYRCQWHRIELELAHELPPGSQITVRTISADDNSVPVPPIDSAHWAVGGTFVGELQAGAVDQSEPNDVLVQSREGQFLRLMIQLHGDGYTTPEVRAVRVYYPRQSYLGYLPAVYSADDESHWFLERFLSIFQTDWDQMEAEIENITALFDPSAVPARFLDYLASWLSLPLEATWDEEQKRALLRIVPQMYKGRGTAASLALFLRVYLQNLTNLKIGAESDFPVLIEGFRERQRIILAGEPGSHLGRQALLWGPAQVGRLQLDVFATEGEARLVSTGDAQLDIFHEYANRFRVCVPAAWVRSASDEQMLRRAIEAEKPAHATYDLYLVEPRIQVGIQSTVGIDTIIGEYPSAHLACRHAEEISAPSRAARGRLGYDMVLAAVPQPAGTIKV